MSYDIVIEHIDGKVTPAEVTELLTAHAVVEGLNLAADAKATDGTQVAFATVECGKHGRASLAALDGQTHWGRALRVKVLKQGGIGSRTANGAPAAPGGGGRAANFGGRGAITARKSGGRGR